MFNGCDQLLATTPGFSDSESTNTHEGGRRSAKQGLPMVETVGLPTYSDCASRGTEVRSTRNQWIEHRAHVTYLLMLSSVRQTIEIVAADTRLPVRRARAIYVAGSTRWPAWALAVLSGRSITFPVCTLRTPQFQRWSLSGRVQATDSSFRLVVDG